MDQFLRKAEIDAEKASAKIRPSNLNFGIKPAEPVPRVPVKKAKALPEKKPIAPKSASTNKEKESYLKGIKDLESTMEKKRLNHLLLQKAKEQNLEDEISNEKTDLETFTKERNVKERYKMEDGLMYALRLITYV